MHSGVIETDVIQYVLYSVQRFHWHRCVINFVDFLREFEAIFKKALIRVSGA
jgi:hypothetical protein